MSSERNRHALIDQMERLYLDRAWSDQEMAERVETDRTNVWKIRTKEMEAKMGIPFISENGRHRIDRTAYVANIRLTPSEALALYIGGRRLQQHTKTGQKDVASALEKLANALHQPLVGKMVQAARVVLDQEQDTQQVVNLRKIMEGWMSGRRLRLTHRVPHAQAARDYIVTPYQLEPAVWGDGVYLIGYSDYHRGIATFRLSRIERVSVTTEPFDPPTDFDGHIMLRHAWGIWRSDKEPETVQLRFTAHVTPYVRETIWHPEQTIQASSDGGCIWQAEIAEWREMLPWVRGWGSDVEVLAPAEMREEVKKTAVRLSRQYKTMMAIKLPYHIPYAKTNPDNRKEIHLLLYHLIDVGQVAQVLWQDVLTGSIRQRLAQILGLSESEAGRFVAFLASLHDLGKAGPAYQRKYAPNWLKQELNDAGLVLQDVRHYSQKTQDPSTPHGTVSTWALRELLPDMLNLDRRFARRIAAALGGHHGAWPPSGATNHIDDTHYPLWDQVRRDIVWELQAVFAPPQAVKSPPSPKTLNTFLTLLSGLVSVADWLGSRNKECFGFFEQPVSTRQYALRAAEKAAQSLQDLGWLGWQPTGEAVSFAEAFAYLNFESPRRLQQAVLAAAADAQPPLLLILEAPTGIGKTETAVYLADTWLQQHQGRGLYIAMPTQATSNQMYGRIGDFLNHRYPDQPLNYHLVHGQAAWLDELKRKVTLQSVGDDRAAGVSAESWFNPRKRTLLAPFGVGTVDQTLLSILQTRHFFVRLFGLSHKVVIFDEVHAYDTYMSTLFSRLLEWLSAIGTSVIILSATLPAAVRSQLVAAYSGGNLSKGSAAYPALTIVAPDAEPQTISLPSPVDITLHLNWDVGREPHEICSYLQTVLTNGGCAAVICNRVQRAQDVYRVLEKARQNGDLDIEKENLTLFHARFPPVWRQAIEEKVLHKFGKNGDRPEKAIVVATQVIEQSLDLDFDVMLTDLAPIDLLIQRAGRLHRHNRGQRAHPRRLTITQPDKDAGGLPQFGKDQYVYAPYVLLRTYLALHERTAVTLPQETAGLIAAVYDPAEDEETLSPLWQAALRQARQELKEAQREAVRKAKSQLVYEPTNRRLLRKSILGLEEDDPDVHHTFRAQTRDIDPGIQLVCLHQEGEQVSIMGKDGPVAVDLMSTPSTVLIRLLLQNSITVQQWALVDYFLDEAQAPPASWRQNSSLRHCRPVRFVNNEFNLDGKPYRLRLSQEFGLEIIKEEAV